MSTVMRLSSIFLSAVLIQILAISFAFGQKKSRKDSLPSYAEIMPKFSEMMDHVSPLPITNYRLPAERMPGISQMRSDGSTKIIRTEEILVPAEAHDGGKVKKENHSKVPRKKL